MPEFVFLWTDLFLFGLLAAVLVYVWRVRRSPSLRQTWKSVARTPSAMCAAVLLCFFVLVALLDSVHYRPLLPPLPAGAVATAQGPVYPPVLRSALDDLLAMTQFSKRENTYSAPLALRQFSKETMLVDGRPVRDFPRLKHAGQALDDEA